MTDTSKAILKLPLKAVRSACSEPGDGWPEIFDANDNLIVSLHALDDDAAALICRSVNAHDDLVAALGETLDAAILSEGEEWEGYERARAALAKARGDQ